MKKKSSKKPIKFKKTADTYFDLAEEKLDGGDYESAVYNFYRAYEEGGGVDALIALGETYFEMGEPEEGLNYLFRALDKEPKSDDICTAIAQCFLALEDDDTSLFYVRPNMTLKKYKHYMREAEWALSKDVPPVRLVEQNSEMIVDIAVKLLSAGDNVYAKELLQTIRSSDKDWYCRAMCLLAMIALDDDKPDEALKHIDEGLNVKEVVELRCWQAVAYFIKLDSINAYKNSKKTGKKTSKKVKDSGIEEENNVGEAGEASAETDNKTKAKIQEYTQKLNEIIEIIESSKLDSAAHTAAGFAYIKMGDAVRAERHLSSTLSIDPYNCEALISRALALHAQGRYTEAKSQIVSASRLYPDDIAIQEVALAMAQMRKGLRLYPMFDMETLTAWAEQTDRNLKLVDEGLDDEIEDKADFKRKVEWLYQTRMASRQASASLSLAKNKAWHAFLREKILNNDMDMSAKKATLYALLFFGGWSLDCAEGDGGISGSLNEKDKLNGKRLLGKSGAVGAEEESGGAAVKVKRKDYISKGSIAIVMGGLYLRLKVKFPVGMNAFFARSYCKTFCTLAFMDYDFETRLLNNAIRVLSVFNCGGLGLEAENDEAENTLAALLFYLSKRSGEIPLPHCAHIFACNENTLKRLAENFE